MSAPRSRADDPLVLERLGDVAADDPLGQALDDGGLADAGLADEDRVVLRPPREDLDDPPDLVVAADRPGRASRPAPPGSGRGRTSRGPGTCSPASARGDPLAAADPGQRAEEGLAPGPVPLQEGLALAADVDDPEQQVLGGDELVAEAPGLLGGALQHAAGARRRGSAGRRRPWPAGRGARPARPRKAARSTPDPAEGLGRDPLLVLDEGGEEVLGVEDGALEALGEGLGAGDRLLGLLGEVVRGSWRIRAPGRGGRAGSGARAGVGLVDGVEDGGRGRAAGLVEGGQDDPHADEEVAAVAALAGGASPGRRGGSCGPAGCRRGS